MSTQVQRRRGNRTEHVNFVGAVGEISVVENEWSLRVHDGSTQGGHPIHGVIRHSATLPSAGWYRIAESALDIGGNFAQFVVNWDAGDDDLGQAMFVATCNLGNTATTQNVQINELTYSTRNNNVGITFARILYAPDYEGGYAYLEVYLSGGETEFFYTISDAIGWKAIAPVAGSVPGGYADRTVWLGYDHTPKRRVITTQSTEGWYRVASTQTNVGRNQALFQLDWTSSENHHGQAMFIAGCNFAYEQTIYLKEVAFAGLGRSTGITKVRIVYKQDDYVDEQAHLEVYLASSIETGIFCTVINPLGWLIAQPTAGGVPEGYTSRELSFEGGEPFDFGTYFPGTPDGESTLFRYIFTRTVTFPQELVGSFGRSEVAATSEAIFTLRRNDVEFATMTFAPASTSATFAFSIPDGQIVFDPGDALSLVTPAQDATLEGLYFTLKGLRGQHAFLALSSSLAIDGPTGMVNLDNESNTTSNRIQSFTIENGTGNYYTYIDLTPLMEYGGLFVDLDTSTTASHGWVFDSSASSSMRAILVSAANSGFSGTDANPLAVSVANIEALFAQTNLTVVPMNFVDNPYTSPTPVPDGESRIFTIKVGIGTTFGAADAETTFQVTVTNPPS